MLELTYFWFRNSGPNLPMWCHQNPVLVKVNSGDHADFFFNTLSLLSTVTPQNALICRAVSPLSTSVVSTHFIYRLSKKHLKEMRKQKGKINKLMFQALLSKCKINNSLLRCTHVAVLCAGSI